MAYNPNIHTATNKPYGLAQAGPTDARSYYYDTVTFSYRPYHNTGEVLAYLNDNAYRTGSFSVFIQASSGTPLEEWWFKDGFADSNLVQKTSGNASETAAGSVRIATTAEVQISTGTPPLAEEAAPVKVVSRNKLYNWWDWARKQAWTITAQWIFGIIKLNATANASPAAGQLWAQTEGTPATTNYKVFKTATEDMITSESNLKLAGGAERVIVAGQTGGIAAAYTVMEEVVTDIDIINACVAGSFTLGNEYTSPITLVGKIMYKGQWCKKSGYMYKAFADNVVTRIPLG